MSRKSKELTPYIIALIPLAYAVGYIGLKFAGVNANAEFNGKYFMILYMAACILIFVKFLYDKNIERKINHG